MNTGITSVYFSEMSLTTAGRYFIAFCIVEAGLAATFGLLPHLESLVTILSGVTVIALLTLTLLLFLFRVSGKSKHGAAGHLSTYIIASLFGLLGITFIIHREGAGLAAEWTFVLAFAMALCWVVQVRAQHQRRVFLSRAEATGWQLSEADRKTAPGFDVFLLREMDLKGKILFFAVHLLALACVEISLVPLADAGYMLNAFIALCGFVIVLIYYARILQKQILEKNVYHAELQAAHDMQMGLLPPASPQVKGLDLSSICLPASEVGGDYYGYFDLRTGGTGLGLAVADVSGKAMKAAITAVMTSAMLNSEVNHKARPHIILENVNRTLADRIGTGTFVALIFADLDPENRTITYSNAGQVYPILLREGRATFLSGASLPLGMDPDIRYEETTIPLEEGDIIVFYSDGIPEAMNADHELYGFERLEKTLCTFSPAMTSREILDALITDVRTFSGDASQHDDLTLVVCRVH